MKVKISLSSGIISGEDKRFLESVFVDIITFQQRKQFDEYYYNPRCRWTVDVDVLQLLVKYFGAVKIMNDELEIEIR